MSLSLEDIWGGFLGIEHLILCADYAMWLAVEYDGHDEKTPIRLHGNFERQRDKHINEFLADHRGELDSGECPNCGRKQRGTAPEKCPDCGVKRDEERYIREWAWRRLRFSVPGLQARCIVPTYLCDDLRGPYSPIPSGEVDVPLAVVRASLLRHVNKMRNDYVRDCWDDLHISTSWDSLPNDSSPEEYKKYLANREKLLAGYNRLTGKANEYPEFTEDYKAHTGIRTFQPPIEMRGPVVERQSAQAGGDLDVQTPAAKPTETAGGVERTDATGESRGPTKGDDPRIPVTPVQPPGKPDKPTVDDPITIAQAALLVHKEPKTLLNPRKTPRPNPVIKAAGKNPAIYSYRALRPWLLEEFPDAAYRLPEKYAEAVRLFS